MNVVRRTHICVRVAVRRNVTPAKLAEARKASVKHVRSIAIAVALAKFHPLYSTHPHDSVDLADVFTMAEEYTEMALAESVVSMLWGIGTRRK